MKFHCNKSLTLSYLNFSGGSQGKENGSGFLCEKSEVPEPNKINLKLKSKFGKYDIKQDRFTNIQTYVI